MPHPDGSPSDSTIARDATYHRAPGGLRARVRAGLREAARAERPDLPWRAFALGAACGMAALLTWNTAMVADRLPADEALGREVLAAHVRSVREGGRLMDVASTDQHAVKPWFTGKIDYAPPVRDMAAAGFALAGGRLDQVGGHVVAALVYRYRLHTVNVFVWPDERAPAMPHVQSLRGFALRSWECAGMRYWAISDVAPQALAVLAEASCSA